MPATETQPSNTPPGFLVGVDGGGSGTRARLLDPHGQRLSEGHAGPSALGQGIEQAWVNVRLAVQHAFLAAGLSEPEWPALAIGLGLAGAGTPSRSKAFLSLAPPCHGLALDTDIGVALLGAHAGRPGAVVAAGTGSVGQALRRNGQRVLVGGWGFGIGDEGGGAWMGQAAMRTAQAAMDGRAPVGTLAMGVWQLCGGRRETLIEWCAQAGQHGFAQLAPVVFDTAGTDPAAQRVLALAAGALADIALALDPEGELPVAIMGSIGALLLPRLPTALQQRCVRPAGDAMDGALQLIRQRLSSDRPA